MKRLPAQDNIYNAGQSWHCVMTAQTDAGRVIRAHLTRNAYDHQSGLSVKMLTDNGWKRINWYPMTTELQSYPVSYVQQQPDRKAMIADCELALELADWLLELHDEGKPA